MDSTMPEYKQKLEELKRDLPFLLRVLEKLRGKNPTDPTRKTQLEKIQKLYDLINDKTEVLKWETLLKCETVVKRLQKKMELQTELTLNNIFCDNGQISQSTLSTENLKEDFFKTSKTENLIKPKINDRDEIPVPESPPPQQQESDIEILPIVIPTEWRSSPPSSPVFTASNETSTRHREQRRPHNHSQGSQHSERPRHQHSRHTDQDQRHQQHHHHHHRHHERHQQQTFQQNDSERLGSRHHSPIFSTNDSHQHNQYVNLNNNNKNQPQNQMLFADSNNYWTSNVLDPLNNRQKMSQFNETGISFATTSVIRTHTQCYNRSASSSTTTTFPPTTPKISSDLLKQPPLSAHDLSKLLNDVNSNSNSNSNTFDYEFDKLTKTDASSTPNTTKGPTPNSGDLSTFELIRKKFALLTKGKKPHTDSNTNNSNISSSSSENPNKGLPATILKSQKATTGVVAHEKFANLANVNVLPTLRPNDPRLRHIHTQLNNNSSSTTSLPHTSPQSSHQIVPLMCLNVPAPLSKELEDLEQSRRKLNNITLDPIPQMPTMSSYAKATLKTSPQAIPTSSTSSTLHFRQNESQRFGISIESTTTAAMPLHPIYSSIDGSDENWDADDDNACDNATTATITDKFVNDSALASTQLQPRFTQSRNSTATHLLHNRVNSISANSFSNLPLPVTDHYSESTIISMTPRDEPEELIPECHKSVKWKRRKEKQQQQQHSPAHLGSQHSSYNNNNFPTSQLNDAFERSKYLKSKKQKNEMPRTYGAYKEWKARTVVAETDVASKSILTNENENSKEISPIANTTLDNLYRSSNLKTCELPKANIASFKIPKKQTAPTPTETSTPTATVIVTPNELGEHDLKAKANNLPLDKPNEQKVDTNKMAKPNERKKQNILQNTAIKSKNSKEKSSDKVKDCLNKSNNNNNEAGKEFDEHLKPNPQCDGFTEKLQRQQEIKAAEVVKSVFRRDPRLERKQQQEHQQKLKENGKEKVELKEILWTNKETNASDAAIISTDDEDCIITDEFSLNDNDKNDNHENATKNENLTKKSTTKTFEEYLLEREKSSASSISSNTQMDLTTTMPTVQPRRIMTRRNTMVDRASVPEVDKAKLLQANSMLFEDLEELKRKKKAEDDSLRANSNNNRRHTGEICYDKTDDACTVSTQNIIIGKRRTRAHTINFNEVQQQIAVFKHIKKLQPNESKENIKARTPEPTPPPTKVRQKPGPKPKLNKQQKIETEPKSKPKQQTLKKPSTPPPTMTTPKTTAKRIGKRRQTFVDSIPKSFESSPPSPVPKSFSPTPVKQQCKASVDSSQAAALPHVTNIFDSFIQKILNPTTDAEALINKLRDILHDNEVQTLLDVRSAITKEQQQHQENTATIATTSSAEAETVPSAEATPAKEVSIVANESSTKLTESNIEASVTNDNKDNEASKAKQASTVQTTAITKNKHYKTELDRLHDDIRDMFMSKGVLTATGKRMCTFVRPTPNTTPPATATPMQSFKTKTSSNVTLETAKAKTAKAVHNNDEKDEKSLIHAHRKTRNVEPTAAAENLTGRNSRRKQTTLANNEANLEERLDHLDDMATTDGSSNTDSTFMISIPVDNLDTTQTTGAALSDSSHSGGLLREMPTLRPVKPVRLPEEDKLEELLAKTKQPEVASATKKATPTSAAKTTKTVLKKRKKPCPKSKKCVEDLTDDNDSVDGGDNDDNDEEYDDDENLTLSKIKQEILDITVPYEEPKIKKSTLNKQQDDQSNQLKNINPKWHFQSRYAHICVICRRRFTHLALHYKKCHREHFSSRLAPSILHQLKVDNISLSKPILKFAPKKGKKTYVHWLHRCPFCLQYKRTVIACWMEHFVSHTGEHCYECSLCHFSCNKMTGIEKHMKDSCSKLDGRFIHNADIRLYKTTKQIEAHICHLCNFLRLGRNNLERHYIQEHGYDETEAKNNGYTITLINFENVPLIDNLEEAAEVEEKLKSQFNEGNVDLINGEKDADDETHEIDVKKLKKSKGQIKCKIQQKRQRKSKPKNEVKLRTEENFAMAVEDASKQDAVASKLPIKNIDKCEINLKDDLPQVKNQNETTETEVEIDKSKYEIASLESQPIFGKPLQNVDNSIAPPTTPLKALVSNAFMSTTDDSNDEEATTSRLLVKRLYNTNNEVEDKAIKPRNKAPTISERLSQRLKEAEEKATSPKVQQTPQQNDKKVDVSLGANSTVTTNTTKTDTTSTPMRSTTKIVISSAVEDDVTIDITEADEEDDGWEDIEIVEIDSAVNTGNSNAITAIAGTKDLHNKALHKSKINNLQKFSRLMSHAPMMGGVVKARKKQTKGLKSLMTMLSDNPSNIQNEAAAKQTAAPKITTTATSTTSNCENAINAKATSSTTATTLGFRSPALSNFADLLPDSSSNDILELAPELRPSGPLQDLNDLTSFLGENLNNIMDMDVDANALPTNSICIHSAGNSGTTIQDALDFVTSQTNNYEMPAVNSNGNASVAVTTVTRRPPASTNRVQNVGIVCENSKYKFYCLSDRCTFIYSDKFIGLENHFLLEHPQAKWNGYCDICAAQIEFESANADYPYKAELAHLSQVHMKQNLSTESVEEQQEPSSTTTNDKNKTSEHETTDTTTQNEQTPRIKLRRLSGDCLSTTANSNSNSSLNIPNLDGGSSVGDSASLDYSNIDFNELIRFNSPHTTREQAQPNSENESTANQRNVRSPIQISCINSNDAQEALFTNIGNDFQITSISSGLEPSEFTEIVKNSYQLQQHEQEDTTLENNLNVVEGEQQQQQQQQQAQQPLSLKIAKVVSLNETETHPKISQPKLNIVTKPTNQSGHSLLKALLNKKDVFNNCDTPTATVSKKSNNVESNAQTSHSTTSEALTSPATTITTQAPLPMITDVCSLSSNATQKQSLWSQPIAQESNELAQGVVESMLPSNVNSCRYTEADNATRTKTQSPTQLEMHTDRPDSPEPLVVSEIVPVAQATAGQFVITQTVSAQYNEANANDSNKDSLAAGPSTTLDFNISISAADFNMPLNATSSSIDLTVEADEKHQKQQLKQLQTPPNNKLPALKCMERSCKFNARHFVAMIDHLKMHNLKNDSSQNGYLCCSICEKKCLNIDDYTNHVRALHFPVNPSQTTTSTFKSSSTRGDNNSSASNPTTESNLTEKIRNILNGTQPKQISYDSIAVSSSINNRNMQNGEDTAFRDQLFEIIKNMVAKTGIPEKKLFRCLVNNCNGKLNNENYNSHVLYHLRTSNNSYNGPFSCPHCKFKVHTVPFLKTHLKDHARHNFFCYICLETAANADMMLRHYAEQHNFKKSLKSHELLKTEYTNGVPSVVYYVAHSLPLSTENVHDYGKKLIIEWQRKKAATRTHFKPNEVDLLPMQAIFARDIFCGVCLYKTKVRTNMFRHLMQHKANQDANGGADNSGAHIGGDGVGGIGDGMDQTQGALANNAKRTFMDPVNPVPCLISNERHFDRMTNLASSSLVPQSSSSTQSPAAFEATCKLRYLFVPETKRYICGVPGCQYLTIAEDIFRAHLATLHSGERTYRCPLCNEIVCKKTFASERVVQHLRFHDRTMYQCEQCEHSHYLRHVVEKHALEKHGAVARARILIFIRDEQQALAGVKTSVSVAGRKPKESNANEATTVENALNSPAAYNEGQNNATTSAPSLPKKQKNVVEMNTRPLWQRDDPKRVRQIRGIPMEDEADTERLRKRLRLSEDFYDDEEDGNTTATTADSMTCELFLSCFEFGCFHCNAKEFTLQDLRIHWQKNHGNASSDHTASKPFNFRLLKRLKCAECKNFYGCYWELKQHLVAAHKKHTYAAADGRTKQLVCGYCDYECSNTIQLQRHTNRVEHQPHDIKALTAFQMVQTMRLESNETSDQNSTVTIKYPTYAHCWLCMELFCSGEAVTKHANEQHSADIERFAYKEYTNTILYRCSECAYANIDELDTLRHMINHYNRFKRCHFCSESQITFNAYMQHCYVNHRTYIRNFSELYTLADIRKFLLRMLVIFPNGWIVDKCNLRDTPYGNCERIKEIYVEICKISQEPPIPRLSLGRLVARKSIEALRQQQQQQQEHDDDDNPIGSSTSTAAAMQLAGHINLQSAQKQNFTARKISKRRSTVAVGSNDMDGFMKNQQTCVKKQRISTPNVETATTSLSSSSSRSTATTKDPVLAKFNDFALPAPKAIEPKPYSYYGKCLEPELDTGPIFTNISFAGVSTRIPLEKFKTLVQLDVKVVLEKLDVTKLSAVKNAAKYHITNEGEIGSVSGNSTTTSYPYANVKKACPANQKYRFT